MRALAKTICLSVSLIFALTGAASLHAQVKILTDYERLTIAHGLSNNEIHCLFQDSRGFLWIGTANGLNRYDGYDFTVFKHEPGDSTSIAFSWVNAIYEDRGKRLWIATAAGLSRFDSDTETFTNYKHDPNDPNSLSGNEITALHEDANGNLWIGVRAIHHHWGLNKLDTTGKFIRYKLNQNEPMLPASYVTFIAEDLHRQLWIGTEAGGLKKFDPATEQITHYMHAPTDINSISHQSVVQGCMDKHGTLWLGFWGHGLDRFDPVTGKVIHYRYDSQNSKSRDRHWAREIYAGRSGLLWVGSGLLSQFDRKTEAFTHFAFASDYHAYASNAISCIYEDRSAILWIGSENNGLIKLDRRPKRFAHYQNDPENFNSLASNDIRSLYESRHALPSPQGMGRDGMIWMALFNNGVCRFDPRSEQFTHFTHDPKDPSSLGHDYVRPILEDRSGNFWFGTAAGLDRFEPRTGKITRVKHDKSDKNGNYPGWVMTIYEDAASPGIIWFGTHGGGLFKLVPSSSSASQAANGAESIIQYRHDPKDSTSISNDWIWDIHEDRFGNFVVATSNGINLLNRQTGKFIIINRKPGEPDYQQRSYSRVIYEDRAGILWAPSAIGWGRIDLKAHPSAPHKIIPHALNDRAFGPRTCLYEDRIGRLWAGSNFGLHALDPVTEKCIAEYSEKDGLASNDVKEIVGDDAGNLWLLTGKGLCLFNENAPPGKQFRNLDGKDGVINSPSAIKGLLKAKDGTIYWGGANGLYRFFPEKMKNNPCVPPIVLTEFRVFNEAVKPALPLARQMALAGRAKALGRPGLDSAISAKKRIKLAHNQNSFSFSFAALDFTRPLSNEYAYRLDGIDQDWIEAGNRRYANYTHIPPGEYVFRVKGSNNDGVWNETGAALKIIITPPYWQTWWFQLLALLAIAGVLEVLHKYRAAKKMEIARTRLRIARDLHDDVGSSLSNIALMSELMQGKRTLEEKEIKQLRQIGATSRQIVEAMEDIVWAINPDHDKLDNLLLRLKDVAAELLRQQGITYTFYFPEQELLQSLPMNFRRNLLLIYKELLHNVIKHAQATHVDITLTKTDGCLILKLADNGVGFDVKAVKNGTGLKSMQTRAAELKGKLEIASRPGEGTRVTLAVKL
jgi:signal transduction histidine kinase/ligand-binding sensor domain-containing protein